MDFRTLLEVTLKSVNIKGKEIIAASDPADQSVTDESFLFLLF